MATPNAPTMAAPNTPTTMNSLALPVIPPFECSADYNTVTFRWKRWIDKLDNLLIGLSVTDDTQRRALLRHYVGDEVDDIFITLPNTGTTYDSAKQALNQYFSAQHNIEYEVYKFRQTRQQKHETLDQYVTKLRRMAASCNFADEDRELKSQLILGCVSNKLRRHALQCQTITLAELLSYGRATETAERHAGAIETVANEQINWLQSNKPRAVNNPQTDKRNTKISDQHKKGYTNQATNMEQKKQCKFCGKNWHSAGITQCKARGRSCNKCGKANHFAVVCLSKTNGRTPHNRNTDSQNPRQTPQHVYLQDQDADYVLINEQTKSSNLACYETTFIEVNKTTIELVIDSGATTNILNIQDFVKIKPTPVISDETNPTYGYGHIKMNTMGKATLLVNHRGKQYNLSFVISKDKGPSLLGNDSAKQLGVIQFINNISEQHNKESQMIEKHEQLFTGIGKIKDVSIILNIDPTIKPVMQKLRRIPFHLRGKVEVEITELLQADIIERVPSNEPTPWISPIVTVPKKKDPSHVRICVDMRQANKAILRERFITPTIEDVLYQLNGAKHFTCLDLAKGYHQLALHQDSRAITTFVTHRGLFRYKRLHFGVNTAAEIFQHEIRKLLQGINNAINVSDDILIFGKTQGEHDQTCSYTLERLESRGATLNKEKCRFNKTTLKFLGHIFSEEGIAPDPRKIEAINKLNQPTTPKDVRSLLGMATFCSKFIPHLALTAKPLRDLTKQDIKFEWKTEHQQAFDKIKEQMAEATSLAYFDTNKKTQIWTDASPDGIGAILVQLSAEKKHIIAFASHALSDTEKRYSQIEREALALTYATKHFHLFVFGQPFVIITDHKPLIYLFNNDNNILSARLERWKLKLQPYDYTVEYRPGKRNPADYLSRHAAENSVPTTALIAATAEHYVNTMSQEIIPKTLSAMDIKHHTLEDPTLSRVIQNLSAKSWDLKPGPNINMANLMALHKLKHELSTNTEQNIILRGTRLVLPASLQHTVITLAHSGHQGISKTKALLKEKIWFPGIDKYTEKEIKKCISCNAATPQQATSPILSTPLPHHPWESVNIDHKGPVPTGEYLLVLIDQYSRFPIVEVVKSTAAKTNILKLDQIFSTFGTPETIITDNGTPFNSHEFKKFTEDHGIKHRKIIPGWPRANGSVERFNGTLSKILKIGFSIQGNWKTQMHSLLRSYRATPQSSTGRTPAEILFGRRMNIQLPDARLIERSIERKDIEKQDSFKKDKYKTYHDAKHRLITENILQGDTVLVKQQQHHKTSTPFDPKPYTVTKTKDMMITATRPNHQITRHRSFFKLIPNEDTNDDRMSQPIPTPENNKEPEDSEARKDDKAIANQPLSIPSDINGKSIVKETIGDNADSPKCRYNLRTKVIPPKRLIAE